MAAFESSIIVKFDDEQMLVFKRLQKALDLFEARMLEQDAERLELYADKIFGG